MHPRAAAAQALASKSTLVPGLRLGSFDSKTRATSADGPAGFGPESWAAQRSADRGPGPWPPPGKAAQRPPMILTRMSDSKSESRAAEPPARPVVKRTDGSDIPSPEPGTPAGRPPPESIRDGLDDPSLRLGRTEFFVAAIMITTLGQQPRPLHWPGSAPAPPQPHWRSGGQTEPDPRPRASVCPAASTVPRPLAGGPGLAELP